MVNLERLKAMNLGSVDHPDLVVLDHIDVIGRHMVSESLLNVVNVSNEKQSVRKSGRVRFSRRLIEFQIFPFTRGRKSALCEWISSQMVYQIRIGRIGLVLLLILTSRSGVFCSRLS